MKKRLIYSIGFLVLCINSLGSNNALAYISGARDASPAPYVNTGNNPGNANAPGYYGTPTAAPVTAPAPSSPSTPAQPSTTSTTTQAAPAPGGAGFYQVKLQEPLSGQSATLSASNGVDLINQYISMIYMWAASIIGVVAVLMIVVSGLQIIFGGAHTEFVSEAKGRIMQALLSLVLLFCTALLLRTINPNFFGFG